MAGDDIPKIAILLCGGEGTRLRPLTYEIPKPLIPIQGKPTVEHIIEELHHQGVERMVITTGYKAEKIIEYFDNSDKKGMVDFVVEKHALGTGGALKFAYEKIKGQVKGDILGVNGDSLIDFDLADMYRLHRERDALVTILVKEVEDVTGYGVLVLEGDRVKRFVEKPDPRTAPSNLINMGIFIINKKAIQMLPDREVFSFERDFLEKAVETGRIHAYLTTGQFWPTDNMERYEKAIFGWRDHKARSVGKKKQ